MLKVFVHYGCFMFVQLQRALITKPSFVPSCPGCSSGSIAELCWMQCSLCGAEPKEGRGAVSCSWGREERTSPVPESITLTGSLWMQQQSLDCVITRLQPHCWIVLFCVLLRDAVSAALSSQGYFPGKKGNVLLCKCLPGCWDNKDTSPTKEVEPFHQLHVKFRNRRE